MRTSPVISTPEPDGHGHAPRLPSLDGWRALSVIGVFWIHAWIHTGNPAFTVFFGSLGVNLQRLPVLLGNGVDFFFVLSGFCIHQSLTRVMPVFTARGYLQFVLNRWLRLSPAFYVVCAATAGALAFAGQGVSAFNLAAHAAWLFNVLPGAWQLATAFWSLQVEWEFYLLAPLLLLIPGTTVRWIATGLIAVGCIAARYHLHDTADGVAETGTGHLPAHFSAFFFGMIVAEGWRTRARWLARMNGLGPLLAGLVIAYLGRGIFSTEAFVWFGDWGVLAKTLGSPLMTFGFAVMLAATLGPVRGVSAFLASAPLQTVGRLSYGLYLWHWWPCVWLGHVFRDRLGETVTAHYMTLVATLAVCFPLAWLTHHFCERPYFRHAKRRREAVSPTPGSGLPDIPAAPNPR